MRVEVVMPQMGESIVEGTVVNWHKKVGDRVKRDEDIFTISTDKVDADIPSPAEGVLAEVLVEVGTTVEVGTPVAYIETEAAAGAGRGDGAAEPKPKPDERPRAEAKKETEAARKQTEAAVEQQEPRKAEPKRPVASSGRREPEPPVRGPQSVHPTPSDPEAKGGEWDSRPARRPGTQQPEQPARGGNGAGPEPPASDVDELRRTRSTPLVRKIAREHGIQDLSVVPGTGASGRVTKSDILSFISRADEMEHEEEPAPARAEAPRRQPGVEAPPVHVWDDDKVEPMTRMRKAIAEHMVMSRRVSPHVQTVWECDWTKVARAKDALKEEFASRGVKLTYTAFLVRAAVEALKAHPSVNASVDGDKVIYRNRINVGVAVALPDGLIVPVVKRADELSLLGIARAVNDLSERARTKKLKLEEVEGGTFSITNPGVFGSLFGIPIINQPQVAILGVGAIKRRLTVDDDEDVIRIRPQNLFCLSFDHRIVDGAVADYFMKTYVDFLEGFEIPRGE